MIWAIMVRASIACSLVLSATASAGCFAHIDLDAPPKSAPVERRLEAYGKLRPVSMHQTQVYHVSTWGTVTPGQRTTDYLQLAGGQRVYYPEDLLPLVPEDSPTAKAARESVSDRSTGATLMILWGVTLGVGAGVALVPYLVAEDATEVGITPLLIGIGIMVASAGLGIPGALYRKSANEEAATAFETFEPSLRKQLDLCVAGTQLVGCREGPAPPVTNAPCVPTCRSGFMCVNATCVSACNPPCSFDESCVGEGPGARCERRAQ